MSEYYYREYYDPRVGNSRGAPSFGGPHSNNMYSSLSSPGNWRDSGPNEFSGPYGGYMEHARSFERGGDVGPINDYCGNRWENGQDERNYDYWRTSDERADGWGPRSGPLPHSQSYPPRPDEYPSHPDEYLPHPDEYPSRPDEFYEHSTVDTWRSNRPSDSWRDDHRRRNDDSISRLENSESRSWEHRSRSHERRRRNVSGDRSSHAHSSSKRRDEPSKSHDRGHRHRSTSHTSHPHSVTETKTESKSKSAKVPEETEQEKPKNIEGSSEEKKEDDNEEQQSREVELKDEVNEDPSIVNDVARKQDEETRTPPENSDTVVIIEDVIDESYKEKNIEKEDSKNEILIRKDLTHEDIHHFKPIAMRTSAKPKKQRELGWVTQWEMKNAALKEIAKRPTSKQSGRISPAEEQIPWQAGASEEVNEDSRRLSSPALHSPVIDPQQYVEALSNPDMIDPPRLEDLASELVPVRKRSAVEDDWRAAKRTCLLGAPPAVNDGPPVGEYGFFSTPVLSGPTKMRLPPVDPDAELRRPPKPGLLDRPHVRRPYDDLFYAGPDGAGPSRPRKPGLLDGPLREPSTSVQYFSPSNRNGPATIPNPMEGFAEKALTASLAQSDVIAEVAKKGIADLLLSSETLKAKITEIYSEELKKLLTKGVTSEGLEKSKEGSRMRTVTEDGGSRPRSKGLLEPPGPNRDPSGRYYGEMGPDWEQRPSPYDGPQPPQRSRMNGPFRGPGSCEFPGGFQGDGPERGWRGAPPDAPYHSTCERRPPSPDFRRGPGFDHPCDRNGPPNDFGPRSPGGFEFVRGPSMERPWGSSNGRDLPRDYYDGPPGPSPGIYNDRNPRSGYNGPSEGPEGYRAGLTDRYGGPSRSWDRAEPRFGSGRRGILDDTSERGYSGLGRPRM